MDSISSISGTLGSGTSTASSSDPTSLGQADFLELMTAQLQNQDPFEPMENGDFLAQMAQFSTVSGIETLNETMEEISFGLNGNRLTDAAAMLGHSVLVPGTVARPDASGDIRGVVELSEPAASVTIRYTDPSTLETLHVDELHAQAAGIVEFAWNTSHSDIADARSPVRVTIETDSAGSAESYVYSQIEAVSMPDTTDGDLIFTVEDYGLFSALEINSIR
ncbi:MAG: flagellar hook capping FlgD N-terminal domain-containing protein [Pseudomonadota bacterium]